MENAGLEKFVRKALAPRKNPHPEITAPFLRLESDEDFGNLHFGTNWVAITEPFEMESKPHQHDFDQYLIFAGGDMTNMVDLGGEVELTLSEDGLISKKLLITEATVIFIPKGLFHCPLNFIKIHDPKKPILFQDIFFTREYTRS